MKHFNKAIGYYGEDLTCDFLTNNGYVILDRNFTCKIGEIDIISRKGNLLVFTEVKSRYSYKYGIPLESITPSKISNIRKIAHLYIIRNSLFDLYARFDVCEIYFNYDNNNYDINYLENCF
ncbi:YraN family protein [Clostridium sp. MSJ-8]|uniref:YraN family protein n=1 Tax=Clostridium sp. MSJ-8 TaxID=2841510 RepID=UPI001C0E92C0|nr:YraN family protein [Clostridium sp. MSJ-8]MBU5488665.1 YraN family protein [Clostridium sp. MSJ-8]